MPPGGAEAGSGSQRGRAAAGHPEWRKRQTGGPQGPPEGESGRTAPLGGAEDGGGGAAPAGGRGGRKDFAFMCYNGNTIG